MSVVLFSITTGASECCQHRRWKTIRYLQRNRPRVLRHAMGSYDIRHSIGPSGITTWASPVSSRRFHHVGILSSHKKDGAADYCRTCPHFPRRSHQLLLLLCPVHSRSGSSSDHSENLYLRFPIRIQNVAGESLMLID